MTRRRRKPRRRPSMPDPRIPLRVFVRELARLAIVAFYAFLFWLLWPESPVERMAAIERQVSNLERRAGGPGP